MTPHAPSLALLAAAVLSSGLALGVATPAPASAAPGNCDDLDSGRVVVSGNADRVTVAAPAGQLVTGYCVKSAGLKGTTGAPEYVVLEKPVASLSLKHTDGGNLTHYSLTLSPVAPTPTPRPSRAPRPSLRSMVTATKSRPNVLASRTSMRCASSSGMCSRRRARRSRP